MLTLLELAQMLDATQLVECVWVLSFWGEGCVHV